VLPFPINPNLTMMPVDLHGVLSHYHNPLL
jgi:hypothetical protein